MILVIILISAQTVAAKPYIQTLSPGEQHVYVQLENNAWLPAPTASPKPLLGQLRQILQRAPEWLQPKLKTTMIQLMRVNKPIDKRIVGTALLPSKTNIQLTHHHLALNFPLPEAATSIDIHPTQPGSERFWVVCSTAGGRIYLNQFAFRAPFQFDWVYDSWIAVTQIPELVARPVFVDADRNGTLDILIPSPYDSIPWIIRDITSQTSNHEERRFSELLGIMEVIPLAYPTYGEGNQLGGRIPFLFMDKNVVHLGVFDERGDGGIQPLIIPLDYPERIWSFTYTDFNQDGAFDLVIGKKDGGFLNVYAGPDFEPMQMLPIRIPAYSTPICVDLDRDSDLDLLIHSADAGVLYFENQPQKGTPFYFASGAAEFHTGYGSPINHGYLQQHPRGYVYEETALYKAVIHLLSETPAELYDEVAFCVGHLPPEILEYMFKREELDILQENAQAIYDIAEQLPFVTLIEEVDYTTVHIQTEAGTTRLSPKDYYTYVVQPRLQYEIPTRINPSFWKIPANQQGISSEEWIRMSTASPHPYFTEARQFWRPIIVEDKTHGSSVLERVSSCKTAEQAIERMHLFLNTSDADAQWMGFGYESNDYQPMVVFAKGYGSCGEYSLLTAAIARTILLPTRIIVNTGEDHQWVEIYLDGKWHHWDTTMGYPQGWDNASTYDRGGNTIGMTNAWQGNDVVSPSPIYTDTSQVTIQIRDSAGPVDGILIALFSYMNGHPNLSQWGYTDGRGQYILYTGERKEGYAIRIIHPDGRILNCDWIYFLENTEYSITFTFPASHDSPAFIASTPTQSLPESLSTIAIYDSYIEQNQLLTPSKREADERFRTFIGYRGTTIHYALEPSTISLTWEQDRTGDEYSVRHYRLYNPNQKATVSYGYRLPSVDLEQGFLAYPAESTMTWGQIMPFYAEVIPSTQYGISTDGGIHCTSVERILTDNGYYWIGFNPLALGLFPGSYCLNLCAEKSGDRWLSRDIPMHITMPGRIRHQRISASEPSWQIGLIHIYDGIPFLEVMVESETPGKDTAFEIAIYRDKNEDGAITESDLVGKRIRRYFLGEPTEGMYHIKVITSNPSYFPEGDPLTFSVNLGFVLNKYGQLRMY